MLTSAALYTYIGGGGDDMYQTKLDKAMRLEAYVRKMQNTLFMFEVTPDDGPLLGVMSDLLTTIDHAKNDLYWIKKDIVERIAHNIEEIR
jgi:hypothetical protein